MDPTRFDSLCRAVASTRSRRSVISAALGGFVSLLGAEASRVRADLCKAGGKSCRKSSQCCTGLCLPSGGSGAPGDGVCCTADPRDVTCAGVCGLQTNNCEQTVDCGRCAAGDPCTANDQCASDICCDDTCVDCSAVSDTATVCGDCDTCCECFAGDSFGPAYCCPDPAQICGTYPNDVCCSNQTECVDGACVKPVYVCPHEVGGEPVDCRGQNGAGCCNDICCPADKPVCLNGACHAPLPDCSYPDNLSCPAGSTCTANQWNREGACCTNMGSWSPGDDENGEAIIVNECCSLNEKWGNDDGFGFCPTCVPKSNCGCGECTSRTSTPRIG